MKVKKLIEKLEKMNPEAEVRLNDYAGEAALFVNARQKDDTVVWLDGENDIDMSSEIIARFEAASEVWNDELDFYMDLLETGITVDMVRKYMDDETANHMQEYCKEHGLL